MQLISQAEFIERMQAAGLTNDTEPSSLGFGRYDETDRFWVWPWPPQNLLALLVSRRVKFPT